MRTLLVLSLTLISMVPTAGSQFFPDARQLLEREAVALESYDTYQFDERTTISGFGGMTDLEADFQVSGKRPAKQRLEMRMRSADLARARPPTSGGTNVDGCFGSVSEGGGIIGCSATVTLGVGETHVIVSDGRQTWFVFPEANQYMPLRVGASDLMAGMDPMTEVAQQAMASAKVLRAETIEIDRTRHHCWVVESRAERMTVNDRELRNVIVTTWIDQKLGVSVRRTLVATGASRDAGSPGVNEVRMRSEKRSLLVNEPLDDALFVFTPPAGATEVDPFGGTAR